MLGRDRYEFNKKRNGTCYSAHVFFRLAGSVDHVAYSGASEAQNVDALFFMIRRAWCSFHKKHAGTSYTEHEFLHPVGSVGHVDHSGVSGA
jgi:hypothetical protein